jgi:hypothetical protein
MFQISRFFIRCVFIRLDTRAIIVLHPSDLGILVYELRFHWKLKSRSSYHEESVYDSENAVRYLVIKKERRAKTPRVSSDSQAQVNSCFKEVPSPSPTFAPRVSGLPKRSARQSKCPSLGVHSGKGITTPNDGILSYVNDRECRFKLKSRHACTV